VSWQGRFRAALKEPLVHFLFAGLALFMFFQLRGEAVDPESRRIVIGVETAQQLAARFEQSMQRQPSAAEMDGLIRDHIREEIYYREAMRLGLDSNDSIIRRRLRSKMEYLARAEAESAIPDDATLQAWLNKNAGRYAADPVYSFDQIFLGAEGKAAETVKRQISKSTEWQKLGQPISLPMQNERTSKAAIQKQFGEQFVEALATLKPDVWSGPVQSGFGYHLVRLRMLDFGKPPQLADVRQRVENDWRAATASKREAKAYQVLLDGYDIRIEKP
jgi:peptidyl-prolyl cis-trans isomerase C